MKKMRWLSVLLTAVILTGTIGAGKAAEAAVSQNPLHQRLVYHPETGGFFHMFIDADTGQLTGVMLDAAGNRAGPLLEYPLQLVHTLDGQPFDVGYDPEHERFLLVYVTEEDKHEIHGVFLDRDGMIFGNSFQVYFHQDYNAASPELAYDTVNHRFVALLKFGNESMNGIGAAMIDFAQYELGNDPAISQIVASSSDVVYGDIEIVFEKYAGMFLAAWTIPEDGTYGSYVNWQGQSTPEFQKSPNLLLSSADSSHLRMTYNDRDGHSALLQSQSGNFEALTVTTVTYFSQQIISTFVIDEIEGVFSSFIDYDLVYDAPFYVAVWAKDIFDGETSQTGYLSGAFLSRDLNMLEKWEVLAWSGDHDLYPVLAAGPYGGDVLLAYKESLFGQERIAASRLDAMEPLSILHPKISYNPSSGKYLLLYQSFERYGTIIGQSEEPIARIVAQVSNGTALEEAFMLNPGNQTVTEQYMVDCCDASGRFLAVWSEDNGQVLTIKGRFFSEWGEPEGNDFVIADIGTYDELTAVKADPFSGKFAVAFASESEGLISVVIVGDGNEIGDPVILSEMPTYYYTYGPALIYDEAAEAMLAVWAEYGFDQEENDVSHLYGQYFDPENGALIGQRFEIAGDIGGIREMRLLGGKEGKIHVIWGVWGESHYLIHHAEIDHGAPASTYQTLEWEAEAFVPVYDPFRDEVILVWVEYPGDHLGVVKMQDLSERMEGSGEAAVVGEMPVHASYFYGVIDMSPEVIPDEGIVTIFAASNVFFGFTLYSDILHAPLPASEPYPDLESLLRGLDGDPNNAINISDVVKFLRINPSLDRSKIDDLLELIEPVYEPLFP